MIIGGTISFDAALDRLWDAIVIGAGPAGAIAARELARHGKSVLLVERRSWPRQKVCGGCLNEHAISTLKSIGLSDAFSASHGQRLARLILQSAGRSAHLPLRGGVAIDRAEFDVQLVRAAINAGASFLPETQALVSEIISRGKSSAERFRNAANEYREVALSCRGETGTARGRAIIAADGLGHPSLRRLPEFDCQVASSSRVGVSLAIDRLPESCPAGAICMAVSKTGYVGMVRLGDGRGNLAAAVDAASLRGGGPETAVAEILAGAGVEPPDLSTSQRWHGTLPLTRRAKRLAAERLIVLGDAAGYIEPFTGEGIGWAIRSAVSSIPWVLSNLRHWDARSIGKWEASALGQMVRGRIACRWLAAALRKPFAVRLAVKTLAIVPSLAHPFVRQVGRSTELSTQFERTL